MWPSFCFVSDSVIVSISDFAGSFSEIMVWVCLCVCGGGGGFL